MVWQAAPLITRLSLAYSPFMDESCPYVNKGEEGEVSPFIERKYEDEDCVGHSLDESVQRVKRKAREWRGDNPFMMLFVKRFVQKRRV